ncbi:uncharacterized protein LOC8276556 isoform X2 [Ricinus communis]|uniref:Uncharacterized protein n=1 Tax=Ricinus communis TaxID=3988 RepID=B9T3Y1_RICCO|nr:uncharacterized protein LOC8276556 isoform X2 [Ricinus communis]EEF29434.1 conserved hypothetical protein [Ricinus communis]|eukprot:XP_002532950.1 uncharacterized protein LOC8276556 isoform X2 [Ricinus communis]
MAVTCFSSPQILLQKSGPVIKPRSNEIAMLRHGQIPLKKTPALQVRSFKNKVFENQSEGIICYRDENGEIICEGFDEGPRFHQQLSRTSSSSSPSYDSRDAEIINLLHQRLLQVVNGGEFNSADNGVPAVQDDFKWNGFNKFC